ncbi:CerR family C-terminal domain-containing protein [Paenibacillus sp. UMB4589-SE434]|uniref:CerR family C-terminal domain-containing protein n=1 Tax=Paenibacillus sp. UMB4589-SE434 TaxID=3046314 RepID=UPI00254F5611|nr:CerR family C-terminal domain-containing protein [Paenibacillus sp. UMB4589-SE434]MDK8180220.1 CerR family C-terminal domain-containing protein [Paenibacillus sp. UMB4589-SE434]
MNTTLSSEMNQGNEDSTQTRLLEAGLRIFGLHGYEGVRTRTLADEAGVNQSAIPYYFGGKKGLYLAVTRRLTAAVHDEFLKQALIETEVIQKRSKAEAEEALKNVMTQFSQTMIGNHETNARSVFIAREQLQPTEAYDILYEQFFLPLHQMIAVLVGKLMELDANDPKTILIAHAIVGQSIAFSVAKETYLRRQGMQDLDEAHVALIAKELGEMSIRTCGDYSN